MVMHITFWDTDSNSFRYILRRGIAESYGSSFLNFLRNLYTIFRSDSQLTFSPRSVRWPLIVVSICISLMISDAEQLLIFLLAICISFVWENVCSNPLSILKLDYLGFFFFFFLLLSSMSSLYNLDIHPSSDIWYANVFPHFLGCLFILLLLFLLCRSFLACYLFTCWLLLQSLSSEGAGAGKGTVAALGAGGGAQPALKGRSRSNCRSTFISCTSHPRLQWAAISKKMIGYIRPTETRAAKICAEC